MEGRARSKYVRSSPRKLRQVIDLIRGKNVRAALDMLHFMPKKGAKLITKTLGSAVSNIMHQEGSRKIHEENLIVKEAYVDGGPMAKRFLPGPMGRASRIRKRFSHITITVGEIDK
jgi:large subunit ribosomal protein L22